MDNEKESILIEESRRRLRSGQSVDKVLLFLRESGADVSDCDWILVETCEVKPRDAKSAVIHSPVWRDVTGSLESFHSSLVRDITSSEK